jgi:hypothetical protein
MTIRPANLRQDWPWVRLLIQRVIDKTGEPWWPEDVYAAVSAGRALMWVCDEPPGVMVAYPDRAVWTQEPTLHIWVMACDDMAMLTAEGYKVLHETAHKLGARMLTMDSPREGWQRKGWRVAKYKYEREV